MYSNADPVKNAKLMNSGNWENTYLKGLSHEIDFDNIVKN
jgi:hypothetical protein